MSGHEFFFFKQKTAYEMRISDWSSDVCSSDLSRTRRRPIGTKSVALRRQHLYKKLGRMLIAGGIVLIGAAVFGALIQQLGFIGLLALFILLIGVAVLFGRSPFPEPRQAALPKADLTQHRKGVVMGKRVTVREESGG